MLKTNLAVRIGLFSDMANTPDLESNAVNQPQFVFISASDKLNIRGIL